MSGPHAGTPAPDLDARPHPIHEAIRREAERLRSLPPGECGLPHQVPGLAALLGAARAAVDASLPAAFEFYGRRYYLRTRLAVRLEVFDSPAAARPLVTGGSISAEPFGHVPGH